MGRFEEETTAGSLGGESEIGKQRPEGYQSPGRAEAQREWGDG